MSSETSGFLRRQAERLLERAERAEVLEKLTVLPIGTVIVFTRNSKVYGPLTYAGVVILQDDIRFWYLTTRNRNDVRKTDKQLVEWLVDEDVNEIKVVTDVVALGDWCETKPEPGDEPTAARSGWTSHGHWYGPGPMTLPRPSLIGHCGGPGMCKTCAAEANA